MRRVAAALAGAVVFAAVPTVASAATTFSQVSLDFTVNGTSVTGKSVLKASAQTTVAQQGICVRDSANKIVDFSPKAQNAVITTSGTSYTSTKTFAAGTYKANTCYQPVGGSFTTVGASKSFTVTAAPSGPTVLFEDDFNGAAGSLPSSAKWGDYSGCVDSKQAFGGIRCGADETLDGSGHLQVPATPQWGSGLTTAGKYGFTYGTMSAWIKIPATTGYWPAFWSENRPTDYHEVPLYGEEDALEAYTFAPTYAHGNGFHAWAPDRQVWGGDDNYCKAPGSPNLSDGYHKYSVKFEPDRMTGYVDDVQCGAVLMKSSDPSKPWPYAPDVNRTNYLILDLAIGGAGGQQPTPPNADKMLVDRVEVIAN